MVLLKNLFVLIALHSVFSYASVLDRQMFLKADGFLSNILPIHTMDQTITNCSNSRDILKIDYINISPDPPLKGKQVTIDAAGYLKETVGEGSFVDVTVKLGMIRLLQQRFDLCEQIQKVDKHCPLEEGPQSLHTTIELPKDIPMGKYTVEAYVFNSDKRRIACLKATVFFSL